MSSYRDLRGLFVGIASSGLALGACGSGGGVQVPFDQAAFPLKDCESITPRAGVDYVGLRSFYPNQGADGGAAQLEERPLYGVPCEGAPDLAACEAALAALPLDLGLMPPHGYNPAPPLSSQYVWTAGGEVGLATDLDALRALFGEVDTLGEAQHLLRWSTYPYCAGREGDEGIEIIVSRGSVCAQEDRYESIVRVRPDGTTEVLEERLVARADPTCVIGRLTTGATPAPQARARSLGAFLAQMGELEGAAVVAFTRMADELRALGAPAALVRRARAAARDEARHVALVEAEAQRFGARVAKVAPRRLPVRPRLEVALENAREGMVRETYGALTATYQAAAAADPGLARLFARIARDETRHAALSLDLGRFIEASLDDDERRVCAEARAEAVAELDDALREPAAPGLEEALGLPAPEIARAFLAQAFPAAWA